MGFFDIFKKKKKISDQISAKSESESFVKQEKFDAGLRNSSSSLQYAINEIAKDFHELNQDIIDKIEELLIMYDIGTHATTKILDSIVDEIKYRHATDSKMIKDIIIDKLFVYYIQDSNTSSQVSLIPEQTNVILVSGVNGVGKTTSIAKMANYFKKSGLKVGLCAADTFRAGAVKQLEIWAERLEIPIFKPKKEGQDPASVVFESLTYAKENKLDLLLCDTSGRLQNKANLMVELKKMHEIIKKFLPTQPIESLIVLDATLGQNGIKQASAFNEVTKLTGVILTKMDSTSHGGVALAIKDVFNLPIKFIGLGEGIEDLIPFDLELFINGLTAGLEV